MKRKPKGAWRTDPARQAQKERNAEFWKQVRNEYTRIWNKLHPEARAEMLKRCAAKRKAKALLIKNENAQ